MVSIDTNVVVRLLVNDDPAQTKRVIVLFKEQRVFVAKSVVLETEWILRGVYKLDRMRVNSALASLLSLERVVVEDEPVLFAALEAHGKGLDFADALHLASSQSAEAFATFDSVLRTRAKKLNIRPEAIVP
jgi:predicted nucleic-acid-binding protein